MIEQWTGAQWIEWSVPISAIPLYQLHVYIKILSILQSARWAEVQDWAECQLHLRVYPATVLPLSSAAFGLAPWCSNIDASTARPARTASNSGVRFRLSLCSMFAPSWMRALHTRTDSGSCVINYVHRTHCEPHVRNYLDNQQTKLACDTATTPISAHWCRKDLQH